LLRLRSAIAASSRWQYTLCVGFICSVFALRSNLGFASASQFYHSVFMHVMQASLRHHSIHAGNAGLASASEWHHSVFTLVTQTSLRLRSGITASSRWQCRPRFGFGVASQRLHAGNAGLASASQWRHSVFTLAIQASHRLRRGIAVSSRCQCKPLSASLWHHIVYTLAMQASLRLRRGIAVASRRQCRPRTNLANAPAYTAC
jgi:hypothetical protein